MSSDRGKAKVNYLSREGLVGHTDAPDWSFLYTTSTVKDPDRWPGDRVVLPDGRVFRYAKSSGLCNDETAVEFTLAEVQTYGTVATTTVARTKDTAFTPDQSRSNSIVITGGIHAVLTQDQLRGGYVICYGSVGPAQFRGLIGNDAAAADANFTVYLDAALVTQLTAGAGIEAFYNPWTALSSANNTVACSKAGMPATPVDASGKYFWVQTWGPVWCPPTNASFADDNDRGAYWRASGAIEGEIANASKGGSNSTQYAGFLLTKGFTAGPLLMLQVSP